MERSLLPSDYIKDFFGFILILCLYLLQTHFGISSFSHPDNALEVCGLLTPLHIVPEWYFLCQYDVHVQILFSSFVYLIFYEYLVFLFLVFLLFLVSEGLLFVSFFWTSFHSLSSPSLGIWPGEGFYVPDPCELTFANTLLLSNAAISLGNAFLFFDH